MKAVAPLSILLAVAVMLLPWQICDCGEDGPHLKPLWEVADCHPADGPAPVEAAGEPSDVPEDGCGDLFQFEGSLAAAAQDLPAPSERDAFALHALAVSATSPVGPTSTSAPLVGPPGDPRPDSPVRLATSLLL